MTKTRFQSFRISDKPIQIFMGKIIEIRVKAYNQKELALLYEVSTRTMRNWLKPFEQEIGLKIGKTYTPKQVEIIFDKLGVPFYIAA